VGESQERSGQGGIPRRRGTWQAVAIGDCCVVQLREEKILAAFPLSKAKAFNSNPYLLYLLSTNTSDHPKIAEETLTLEGDWASDDTFFLMSDVLQGLGFVVV